MVIENLHEVESVMPERPSSESGESIRLLRRSEERFRLLAESAIDLIMWSRDGRVEWISPSVTTLLGWTDVELVGRTVAVLVHPADRDAVAALREEVYSGGQGMLRVRLVTRSGDDRTFEVRSAPFRDADGRLDGAITSGRDVSDQIAAEAAHRHAEEQLADREERYRLLAENASDLVYFANSDGRATWVAPTVFRSLGWDADELVGSVITDLFHPDDWDVVAAIREIAEYRAEVVALRPGVEHPLLARVRHRSGQYRWMSVSATMVHPRAGRNEGIVVGMRDVDELVATQKLAEKGKVDDLTGLVNRPHLLERLEQILSESRRTSDQNAVLYCDVDYFKEINDTYGHAVGDKVLRTVAVRIRESVREQDVVARLGGDEFVVVLRGVNSIADAEAVAQKIRAATKAPLMVDGIDLSRSFSIGVAMVQADSTPDRALRDADAALYEAKEAGRDRTVTHRH